MPDLSLLPLGAAIEGNDLLIAGCSVTEIAAEWGTPAYVIDERSLRARARAYLNGLVSRHARGRICFAMKSFPSPSMVSILASEGLGLDVVGAGELPLGLAGAAHPLAILIPPNPQSHPTTHPPPH